MSPYRPRKGKQLPPVALSSPLAREALPAPLVYYPNRSGIFIAFAAGREEQPVLCACAEGAVRNLLRLTESALSPLDYGLFPDVVSRSFVGQEVAGALRFGPGLCHRCNLVAPSLRYCHERDGTRFVQSYGWYINQTYLRLGIHPVTHKYLPDVCPPEYHDLLNRIQALLAEVRALRARQIAWLNGERDELPPAEPLEAVEQQLLKPRYDLRNLIENVTRAEFGVRAIGEGWVSETQLFYLICRLCPGEQVLRHHRPDWMEGLELDIYLPGRRLAIEYQGQQHFHPIKVWGGAEALAQLQARDARKVQLCRQAGLELVTVDYTEPLTEEHIRERLSMVVSTFR